MAWLGSCARATRGLGRYGSKARGAFFAHGARALGRASLDGRSEKFLMSLLGLGIELEKSVRNGCALAGTSLRDAIGCREYQKRERTEWGCLA